uniref:Uncharacterized protein n=1 Tax=Timema shepardi TaxID=629360 RepID=A0A7R9AM41_TIMSH|nr:unnamed protein product [Timema shepardi]
MLKLGYKGFYTLILTILSPHLIGTCKEPPRKGCGNSTFGCLLDKGLLAKRSVPEVCLPSTLNLHDTGLNVVGDKFNELGRAFGRAKETEIVCVVVTMGKRGGGNEELRSVQKVRRGADGLLQGASQKTARRSKTTSLPPLFPSGQYAGAMDALDELLREQTQVPRGWSVSGALAAHFISAAAATCPPGGGDRKTPPGATSSSCLSGGGGDVSVDSTSPPPSDVLLGDKRSVNSIRGIEEVEFEGSEPAFAWRESGKPFRENHPTEIRTLISPSSAVELNTTSALGNYTTEAA